MGAPGLELSPFTRVTRAGSRYVVHHALFGNANVVNEDLITILDEVKNGSSIEDISSKFKTDESFSSVISELTRLRYLIPKGTDERAELSRKQEERKPQLGVLRLYVTFGCNFDCSYCLNPTLWADSPDRHMTPAMAKLSVHNFLEKSAEWSRVRFFGGEPLLNLPAIHAAIEEAEKFKGKKVSYILNTNGSLMTDEVAALCKAKNMQVIISLDGAGSENDAVRRRVGGAGSFGSIVRGIELARDHGNRVDISCVVTDKNKDRLHELVDVVRDLKVLYLGLSYPRYQKKKIDVRALADAFFDAFLYGKKQGVVVCGEWTWINARLRSHTPFGYCVGAGGELTVMPNGDIFPCDGITRRYGTITDVEGAMQSPFYQEMSRRFAGSIEHCKGCSIEGLCAGGCSAEALFKNGDVCSPSLQECELFRELADRYLTYLATSA